MKEKTTENALNTLLNTDIHYLGKPCMAQGTVLRVWAINKVSRRYFSFIKHIRKKLWCNEHHQLINIHHISCMINFFWFMRIEIQNIHFQWHDRYFGIIREEAGKTGRNYSSCVSGVLVWIDKISTFLTQWIGSNHKPLLLVFCTYSE